MGGRGGGGKVVSPDQFETGCEGGRAFRGAAATGEPARGGPPSRRAASEEPDGGGAAPLG